ncbi:SMYD2, partial [Symbiodinium necroappetens]
MVAKIAHLYTGPLCHLQGWDGALPDGVTDQEWADVYSKVRFNCFESEGSCLLPVMALFNHSCAPNAAITRLGMVEACNFAMVAVSETPILPGTEIVYSYNSDYLFVPFQERRQLLMSNWSFVCRCARCIE